MSEERLNTFRTFEKKMEDGSVVVCCESSIESKELIEQIQESLRGRPVHMIFNKLPEEAKTESLAEGRELGTAPGIYRKTGTAGREVSAQ